MAEPTVSVLLPVRDGEAHLGEALASLSAQTLADFEAIVVDDGSRDGSGAIAAEHARADPRFRVVRQRPGGVVAALERARAAAGGRIIARLDADDVALPDRLRAQVDVLDAEDLVACGGRVEYFPPEAVRDGARRYERWLNGLVTAEAAARDVFVECPLAHPALAVRRDALEAAGGYRDPGWPEDYDLVLRLWAAGGRFRNVETLVLGWREHDRRVSRTHPAFSREAFVRCKVHHLRETLLDGFESVLVWGAGPVGKSFARQLARAGVPVAAFVELDPRKIGREIHGVPVVHVDEAPRFCSSLALGAVAGAASRTQVRDQAAAQGRREGADFVAVA